MVLLPEAIDTRHEYQQTCFKTKSVMIRCNDKVGVLELNALGRDNRAP